MSEVQVAQEGKTLVFNMGGFILKLIFSIGVTFYLTNGMEKINIFGWIFMFFLLYGVATVFGFAVRVTGNYLIALVVFGVLIGIFFTVLEKLENFFGAGSFIVELLLIAVLVWPLIIDIKKAILYVKHTV